MEEELTETGLAVHPECAGSKKDGKEEELTETAGAVYPEWKGGRG